MLKIRRNYNFARVGPYKINCTDKRLIKLPNVIQVTLILNVVDIYTENKQISPVLVYKTWWHLKSRDQPKPGSFKKRAQALVLHNCEHNGFTGL